MAIQTIYTQIDNAKLEQCKRGKPVPPMQIPLLRNNYLGEYRTQAEKNKVLKNLGILGATGNYTYPSQDEVDNYSDITTVQQALDYCIRLIKSYEESDANIRQLLKDVEALQTQLKTVSDSTDTNSANIETINNQIITINNTIAEFDQKLADLNVDDKITNRLHQHIDNSKTIKFEDDKIEVKNSVEDKNAIELKDDGLYVTDNSEQIATNTSDIAKLQTDVLIADRYMPNTTGSVPYTVGGIKEGTTTESLNGKTISDILDLMLFPAYVRNLIQPTLSYSSIASLVEVGDKILYPELTFTKNDAGPDFETIEYISYKDKEYSDTTYTRVGTYVYHATVSYLAGDYLVNNKGETTTSRIEAGKISTSTSTVATYPWYAGNTSGVTKQTLVPFDQDSGILNVSLSREAVIKLPGNNTTLNSFKVNGGLGYLDVDLDGWTTSEEQINGITYKVWTKNSSYASVLPHQLQFKLVQ